MMTSQVGVSATAGWDQMAQYHPAMQVVLRLQDC